MSKALPFRSREPGTRVGRGLLLIQAAALGCLFAAGPAVSQQSGTITGVVSDVATGQLLESAAVRLDDAPGGVLTNQEGRYVMVGVAAGTHTLTFHILGYDDLTAEVEVVAGETLEYNAELTAGALELQELVVTGVARETPKVKVPFTIEKLDIANIPVPAISAEGFLHGKAPGVKVVRGGGQPGSTGDILLRGATSISGGQAPLVIVDGIITTNAFDDLATLDIESIEIVKGAAGASLYGSRAANGVIQIRTKRGSGFGGRDYSRLVARSESGQDQLQGSIQLSRNHPFEMNVEGTRLIDVDGEVIENFPDLDGQSPNLNGENVYTTFQDGEWPKQFKLYDHVDRIYSPGTYMSNYGAVEGRNGDTNYRSSFEWKKEGGVLPQYNDGFDRRGFRINLDHKVRNNLNISLTTAYTQSEQHDLGSDPFYDLTFMGPYVDLLKRDTASRNIRACKEVNPNGCLFRNPDPLSNQLNPLYTFELVDYRDWLHDVKAAASGIWTPFAWLDVEGLFGLDRNSSRETNYAPPGYWVSDGLTPAVGSLGKGQSHRQATNGEITVSANKAFGDLTTRTRVRYLERATHYESFSAAGSDFIAEGIPRFQNLDPESFSAASYISDTAERGLFLISALDYRGKYLVDGLIRQDESSRFGPENRKAIYHRTAFAWRLSMEDWWPLASSVNEFKLHWSRGTAGRRPGFAAQYETYQVTGGTIVPNQAGNANLKPQRSTENEFGLYMVLFNKASTSFTYARTTSTEQLLSVPLPAAGGFTTQVQNAGILNSNTWEFNTEVPILDTENLSWNVRLNMDRSVSRIEDLQRPAFRSSFFYYRNGEIFGSFFGNKWAESCDELPVGSPCDQFQVNDDGLLVWTGKDYDFTHGIQENLWGTTSTADDTGDDSYEWGMPIKTYAWDGVSDSTCTTRRQGDPGCTPFAYMGNTTPDLNVSFRSSFRWKDLSVWVLLDGEFGASIYNQTRQWAYRESRSGDQDQAHKADEYKKPVKYYADLYATNANSSWFVESANFVKVRELSVRYALNPDWLDVVFRGRVTGADINLIGRNLYTFTEYSGYDPEVGTAGNNNSAGGSQVIGRIDAYQYPNYRTISASLQLVF